MADAEIIPIGARGRPGRGSGKQRPSAASRGLLGAPSRVAAPKASAAAQESPAPEPPRGRRPAPDSPPSPAGRKPPPPRQQAAAKDTAKPETVRATDTGRATATDREPLAGIPAADWLAAVTSAAIELFGRDWETQLARLISMWRRRIEGDYSVDDYGFDADFTHRFLLAVVRPVAEKWFRIEVRGAENIPSAGGALVVSNHSGTIPMDGLMTLSVVHEHTGRFLRPLGADLVFRLPMVSAVARKTGATLACQEDAERMLRAGELVGVWPEGFKGIGKPFAERYKLQRFGRGGFVSAALRTGVPIVPLSVVGAEEIYPLIGNFPTLARLLGVPYLPITPLFPWLGPLGLVPLPSKWLMEFGDPIRTDALEPGAADDPMLVFNVTDQVRETIQQTLFQLLQQRESVFGVSLPGTRD